MLPIYCLTCDYNSKFQINYFLVYIIKLTFLEIVLKYCIKFVDLDQCIIDKLKNVLPTYYGLITMVIKI